MNVALKLPFLDKRFYLQVSTWHQGNSNKEQLKRTWSFVKVDQNQDHLITLWIRGMSSNDYVDQGISQFPSTSWLKGKSFKNWLLRSELSQDSTNQGQNTQRFFWSRGNSSNTQSAQVKSRQRSFWGKLPPECIKANHPKSHLDKDIFLITQSSGASHLEDISWQNCFQTPFMT